MPLNLSVPTSAELKPKIVVIGVGGAGGNAVNNMIVSDLDGVNFVCANTDAQAVSLSKAENKIQLGTGVTQGLGAGSRPQIGEAAAEESLDDVMAALEGANMLFITAGMGGGTGTGAAPVIAKAARDLGILTVGVVTKPFAFEGARRMRIAEEGIEELSRHVDTLLIIPNQNLFRLADENTTFADAFAMADEVLHAGVKGITDLMIVPGHINLDFADVRTVMSEMGKAMMGTGESTGENRASVAAAAAISNPLLDEMSLKGAKGVLINITGGLDMKLFEVDEAANAIRNEVDPEANIIVGSTFDQDLEGTIRVSVVATGIDGAVSTTVTQVRPAPQAVPAPQPVQMSQELPPIVPAHPQPAPAAASDEANPVGEVHRRIREILTEDADPARETLRQPAARQNPFRGKQPSTLETAMGILRETFKGKPEEIQPRRVPSAKPLTDDDDEVEVPAFLRRN
ncbi:cell division protein FtsZ [Parvularcula sp. ZS-1/3]|uniref:Cell division protein FtsZ n=1 Tax=Parvularcula mediterranea TaxID=2732508 RepID=A0A7Y3RP85_9PROT|nr:cell division protein FtsZ [Parvularcula mediterranea]NNU17703.1 cell division protein FtsZ [Parvularcula mediterranea]